MDCMKTTIAIIVTSLVGIPCFADCVLQAQPREYRCNIEIEYGEEARAGLLVWGSGGIEITAPGIHFADATEDVGSGEQYWGYGLSEYRSVYGLDEDGFYPDPATPMIVDGEPALGAALVSTWNTRPMSLTAEGNFSRNGTPVTFRLLRTVPVAIPEPSSFLLLGLVALAKVGFDRLVNRRLNP